MIREVIHSPVSPIALRQQLELLPAVIAGEAPDRMGVARGLSLRAAVMFLSLVKDAFIVKARGGADEAGIKWPPLTKEYLAYGRGPFSTRKAGKSAPGTVRGGPRHGQQKDGFLSKAQLKLWQQIYMRNLKWLALREPLDSAKSSAAKIAWTRLKALGAQTKIDVFGNRVVDILRDRGTLFNSISPGTLTENGPDASYTPPDAQVVELLPGAVLVGTNDVTATFHHRGTRKDHTEPGRGSIRRQLWPAADKMPESWLRQISRAASSGVPAAIRLIAQGGSV